jgi:hypothetical protein
MMHDDAQRMLVAGAALDDLAPDEQVRLEAHAGSCEECRILEGELDMVIADLALVVPERLPPPDLLAVIRLAIDAEDSRAGSAAPAPGRLPGSPAGPPAAPVAALGAMPGTVTSLDAVRASRASRRPTLLAVGLAAVLGLVAVGLGAQNAGLRNDLDRSVAQVVALRAQLSDQGGAVAAAMNPAHVTVALHAEAIAPQADAMVTFVPGTTNAWLVAKGLPATPSGHGYQLWYADKAGVHPLQTVRYDGTGTFVAPLGVDLAGSTAVMITLEDAGGATGEPGPQVVFGEI